MAGFVSGAILLSLVKYLRVVTLSDGETVYNAFPNWGFKETKLCGSAIRLTPMRFISTLVRSRVLYVYAKLLAPLVIFAGKYISKADAAIDWVTLL